MQQRDHRLQSQTDQLNVNQQTFKEPDLKQSRALSRISQLGQNPQVFIRFFQDYVTTNKIFQISQLHASPNLKLKRYRQSVYYGQFLQGKRQGNGIMLYNNQRIYQGEWNRDSKEGQGFQKFPNGCTYQGQYHNGKPHGVGRYVWKNGEVYDGQWQEGLKHGSGMWQGKNGDSYIGEWKQGKAEGYGVHTWINGDRYQGQFKQCLKHGEGIEKFANGDIYKGNYANGKPSGYGQYYWTNGSYFKGQFKNGLREGQGIWKKGPGNCDKYQGQYSNDKKSGYGIFTWASGNIYKGHYQSDQRHGFGQMYWSDGSFYKGNWNKGIQHGKGQMYSQQEGMKKGLFQNNVLVAVNQQGYQSKSKLQSNMAAGALKSDASQPPPQNQKLLFRTRAYSSKYRSKQSKSQADQQSINSDFPHRRQIGSNNQFVFNHIRTHKPKVKIGEYYGYENKNKTLDQPKSKQKIQHSSFYLHMLHKKGSKKNSTNHTIVHNIDQKQRAQYFQNQQNRQRRTHTRSVHGHRNI